MTLCRPNSRAKSGCAREQPFESVVIEPSSDKVLAAASTTDDQGLYEAQRDVFLDPFDPEVIRDVLSTLLERQGYDVTAAPDANVAAR